MLDWLWEASSVSYNSSIRPPVRLGLIGCGGIVQLSHLPSLLSLPDLVRIVAVADPAEHNRDTVGQAAGISPNHRYADYRDMLGSETLDAVSIATPHHLHAEHAATAAQAGLLVISEKPMATSLAEADAILDAVTQYGSTYTVVHNFLFAPGTRRALALVEQGEVGAPRMGRAKSLFNKTPDQFDPALWRNQPAAGGGCLKDTAYHEIYLVVTMVGSPVVSVDARIRSQFGLAQVDDLALLWLEHENGALSTVSTSWHVATGRGEIANLCEVHGSRGALRVEGRGQGALLHYSHTTRDWSPVPVPELTAMDPDAQRWAGHAGYFAATFEALLAGAELPVSAAAARQNLSIIDAALEASRGRKPVEVPV
jgi:predicted dehydrogenase